MAAVVLRDEGADAPLHGHVQPDGRLVQEDDGRAVEQGRGDLALHPLAEREVAHGLSQERPELEQGDQLVQGAPVVGRRDAVDGAVELEGVRRRDVPDELVALAHDQRDLPQERLLPLRTGRSPAPRARPPSGAGARRASSGSWSCPRRWGRGTRRSRPARGRRRCRRRRGPGLAPWTRLASAARRPGSRSLTT